MKVKFKAWRDKEDIEKALLPALILVLPKKEDPMCDGVYGFQVVLGWWDFAIGIFVGWTTDE